MGVLDDAIREHLELKRRHGASPDEVAQQEAEALGPLRQAGGPPPPPETALADGPDRLEAALEPDGTLDEHPAPRAGGDETAVADPPGGGAPPPGPGDGLALGEPPPAEVAEAALGPDEGAEPSHPVPDTPHDVADEPPADLAAEALAEPPVSEPPLAPPPAPAEPEPPLAAEPPEALREPPPTAAEPEPSHSGDPLGFDEYPDEVPAGESLAPPPVAPLDSADAPPEPPAAAHGEDDVLEETPDFLQETPEHDRLWFEQKPPRDFDFD